MMKEFLGNSYLFGSNAPFIEALYESYLHDPASVEPRWRSYFDELQQIEPGEPDVPRAEVEKRFANLARQPRAYMEAGRPQLAEKQFAVFQLITAYRTLGTRHANVDPLGRQEKPNVAELDPAFYGITDADMERTFSTGTLVWQREAKLREILEFLRQT